jgi:hypothetical protein
MPRKSRCDLSFFALILVAMAFMPVASATSMNADSSPADETIGPVAACDVGIAIDHRSSGDDYAKGTNNTAKVPQRDQRRNARRAIVGAKTNGNFGWDDECDCYRHLEWQ